MAGWRWCGWHGGWVGPGLGPWWGVAGCGCELGHAYSVRGTQAGSSTKTGIYNKKTRPLLALGVGGGVRGFEGVFGLLLAAVGCGRHFSFLLICGVREPSGCAGARRRRCSYPSPRGTRLSSPACRSRRRRGPPPRRPPGSARGRPSCRRRRRHVRAPLRPAAVRSRGAAAGVADGAHVGRDHEGRLAAAPAPPQRRCAARCRSQRRRAEHGVGGPLVQH